MRQVITIDKYGRVSGLHHKDPKAFQLSSLGAVKHTRTSEVIWDEEVQKWFVEFRHIPEKLNFKYLEHWLYLQALHEQNFIAKVNFKDYYQQKKYFTDYDNAVKAEILVLDYLRVNGLAI